MTPVGKLVFFLLGGLGDFAGGVPPMVSGTGTEGPPVAVPVIIRFGGTSLIVITPALDPEGVMTTFVVLLTTTSGEQLMSTPVSLVELPGVDVPVGNATINAGGTAVMIATVKGVVFGAHGFFVSIFRKWDFSYSFVLVVDSFLIRGDFAAVKVVANAGTVCR